MQGRGQLEAELRRLDVGPKNGPRAGSPHVERGFGDQAVREPEPEVARSLSYVGRGVALALQAGTALSRGLRQIRESRRTGL